MTVTAAVCLPWRPQPARIASHDRCVKFWTDNGYPVIEADSQPDLPFLCNEARNNAVKHAEADVIILADADTIPATDPQMRVAIEYAAATGRLVWPHNAYWYIPGDRVDSELPPALKLVGNTESNRGCGLAVITREAYWDIGGFDEDFVRGVGGFDDLAFTCAAETLLGTARVEGVAYSFEQIDAHFHQHRHNGGRESSTTHPNYGRFRFYSAAWFNPERMRDLINNRPPAGAVYDGDIPQRPRTSETTVLTWELGNQGDAP